MHSIIVNGHKKIQYIHRAPHTSIWLWHYTTQSRSRNLTTHTRHKPNTYMDIQYTILCLCTKAEISCLQFNLERFPRAFIARRRGVGSYSARERTHSTLLYTKISWCWCGDVKYMCVCVVKTCCFALWFVYGI